MRVSIRSLTFDEGITTCLDIRRFVFIEEQGIPEAEEIDGKDSECRHYLLDLGRASIATARVRIADGYAKIERVAVLSPYQGQGFGRQLIAYIVEDIPNWSTAESVKLGSQINAIPFYEKLGFKLCSDEYLDAGILHRDMVRVLDKSSEF